MNKIFPQIIYVIFRPYLEKMPSVIFSVVKILQKILIYEYISSAHIHRYVWEYFYPNDENSPNLVTLGGDCQADICSRGGRISNRSELAVNKTNFATGKV
jgi:hypothetical protein